VRLDIRRIDNIKEGTDIVGSRTRVRVVKNKVAPPFKSAEFDIMYGKGISREGSVLDLGAELGILVKSGSWYSYNDERIGQGRENAKVFLMQNLDVLNKVEKEIKVKSGLKQTDKKETSVKASVIDKDIITKELSKKEAAKKEKPSSKRTAEEITEEI
jgi:recombination protein RecA